MILEIQERLALMDLLPKEGDYAALKTLRRSREMLSFTPEELEELEFSNPEPSILKWNIQKAAKMGRDIPVDEWTTNTVREILIKMSSEKKLTDQLFVLYEKFVVHYD